MRGLVLGTAAGILVTGAAVAALLSASVYGDRGRDEIDLSTIHQVPVAAGAVLTQPIPLQRPAPAAIELPYQWRGSQPARIEVSLVGGDGSVLSDTTQTLVDSRAPLWLQPIGDGSYWQHELAAFHSIPLPSNAAGTIVLRLTRLDQQPDALVFFASDLPFGEASLTRPSLVEQPGEFLDLQTEYGASTPALAKATTFVSRIQSLAPPWLPSPLPEALLGIVVAAAIYLFAVMLSSPGPGGPDDPLSPTRSR